MFSGFYVMRHFERGSSPEFFTNLTDEGLESAEKLFIPGIQRIVTSPFIRCRESALRFSQDNGIPTHIACALSEYIDDDSHGIGHETHESMVNRVNAFLLQDLQHRTNELTLYVTHGTIAEYLHGEPFNMGDVRFVEHKDSLDTFLYS